MTEAVTVEWHPQIHRRIAEQDGFTPADFTWLEYPVSNVRLALNPSRHVDLDFLAELPPNTPQVNVYIEEKDRKDGVEYEPAEAGWLKIPDPVGTALAWVRFTLVDTADGAVMHESSSPSHFDGAIQGGLSATARHAPLWKRLTPGGSVQVRVEAIPEFFPWVDENGGGRLAYTTNSNGYFKGEMAISPEYTLALTKDNALLLDGQPAPEIVDPLAPVAAVAEPDQDYARSVRERRQAIEAKQPHLSVANAAAEMGFTPEFLAQVEAGEVVVEDWHKENIERILQAWAWALEES